uniref:Sperm microtubule inner protein 1 C-terminal domain-containing protein n=1 Tax=Monopterus albus TaxID=43700 RepID=A0A3Q3KSD0_MONAL
MRGLLTTQSQNSYREQIQKEMLTRLAWKSRYAQFYPSYNPQNLSNEPTQLPRLAAVPRSAACDNVKNVGGVYSGKGRSLYLQRRGQIRPEEKFDFPLLSSWEYGWRLGDYTTVYRTPSCARSSVVKNTFYAKNGVFNALSATDKLG